jgi:CRP-like cAMP-binding protein
VVHQFITYLHQFVELNGEDEKLLHRVLSVRHFKKGEHLLAEGEVSTSFYFNLAGFVRLYYVKDTVEKTAYFYPENTFISAYESFVQQTPSKLNLQVTEDTSLIELTVKTSAELLSHSPKFETLARIAMEDELIAHQKIIASLLTLTPEERYFQLMKENPEVFQRVPQHYIASYVGVQPESLSRIKKRHFKKNLN